MCYNTNKGWYICATFEEMNMKKAILIIVLISLSLVSCISTKPIPPEEIIYKEITAEGYLYKEYKFPKKNKFFSVMAVLYCKTVCLFRHSCRALLLFFMELIFQDPVQSHFQVCNLLSK